MHSHLEKNEIHLCSKNIVLIDSICSTLYLDGYVELRQLSLKSK